MKFRLTSIVLAAATLFSGASCSSSGSNDPLVPSGQVGGPLAGPEDTHCTSEPLGVSDPAACLNSGLGTGTGTGNVNGAAGDANGAGGSAGDSAPVDSGGAPDCNLTHDAQYGETLYNASGDDDDCKYQVSWVSTPIRKGQNVTFTVTATSKATGEPLTRIAAQRAGELALSRVEPYIPCDLSHAAPSADSHPSIVETAPGSGVFTVGPIVFDESARWTVRFHFYESCEDSETSPHGHIAFFVNVP